MKTPTTLAVAPPRPGRGGVRRCQRRGRRLQRRPEGRRRRRRRRSSRSSPTPCPKPGFDKVIPALQKTAAGKGITFSQSYGASGDQSRKVEAGLPTDIVNFSLEPDVTRLVKSGQVDANWNQNEHKGIPFGSVVTIVVRKGNPKRINDWDDLLKPGVEVVTPEPVLAPAAPSGTCSRRTPTRATAARTRRPASTTSPS